MNEENACCPVGGYFAAFAIGALLGVGVALLYAPHSGKETRDLLAKRAHDLKDKAGDLLDDAKGMLAEKKAEIIAAVEAGKQAIRDERTKQAKAT